MPLPATHKMQKKLHKADKPISSPSMTGRANVLTQEWKCMCICPHFCDAIFSAQHDAQNFFV